MAKFVLASLAFITSNAIMYEYSGTGYMYSTVGSGR